MLSATASINQPCQIDEDCPSGQRCVAEPPRNSLLCELALDATVQDSADATVPNDGASQAEGGSGEANASDVDAQDAGEVDVSDVYAQGAGESEASAADAQDATVPNDGVTQSEAGFAETGDSGAPGVSDVDAQDADESEASAAQDAGHFDASGCAPTFPPSTLVLFGGADGKQTFADTWLWDGATWSSVDAGDATGPSPRAAAAMATACGYAVLVGGTGPVPIDGGSPTKGDAWLWNGSYWQEAPAALPEARFDGVAATLGSTMYLFGGAGPEGVPETKLLAWTGGAWSVPPQSSSPEPVARLLPVAANAAGGLLVFGGADNFGDVFPDTWLLTDASWQQLDDGGSDAGPALQGAGATSVGGTVVVMFGGLDENFNTRGDTWIWNGGTWSMVLGPTDGGPAPRVSPAMGTLNGLVVMFGGRDDNFNALGDTWIWDGGSWGRGPDAGPPPRFTTTMTSY